jgi:GT2 family glycosyltransferase
MNMSCDIIIPVWNQPAFTKDCVDSVIRNTAADYRIIIIDNGSDEETRKYLEGLKGLSRPPVMVVRNERNAGFVKAANQGITLSTAPYICLLNNDTVVTNGWLAEMLSVADSAGDIGIVNPSSNNLGQRPEKGEPVELYAEKLKAEAGRFIELGAAIGFCMLIKRRLIDRIGAFDEIYGMGNFEDTDFSRRAVKEGYRCVRARGAYVYHRESSSFGRLKGFETEFRRNREIYEFRWGRPRRAAYILDRYDANTLKRLGAESVTLARGGNWVWYFLKEQLSLPEHSNIIYRRIAADNFYPRVIFEVLRKKKKFNEIFVGGEKFGRLMERLSFIHKARVGYY